MRGCTPGRRQIVELVDPKVLLAAVRASEHFLCEECLRLRKNNRRIYAHRPRNFANSLSMSG